jgi:hypothetical protein
MLGAEAKGDREVMINRDELGLVCQERDESEQEYRPDLNVLTSFADDGSHQVPQVIS